MFTWLRFSRALTGAALVLLSSLQIANAQWAERFDTLIGTGSNVAPNKCWDLWDQASGANSVTSSAQSLSTPNSILVTGTSDTIQRFSGITSGTWDFTTHVYVPSNSSGRSWFILMNKYLHGTHNNQDWSVQLAFNAATNAIFSQEANVTGTLIEDAWFQVRVRINLNTNLAQIYVNNVLFASHPWVGPNGTNGLMQIQCLDLYAEATTSVAYHDNISLTRVDDCCVEIDPGTKFGTPFLYDTPLAQTFKPLKSGLICDVLTGVELASVPSYDFYLVNAPGGVVPTNYTTNYLYRALNQTNQNTNGIGPVNALQNVLNSSVMVWSTQTYAIIIRKTGGANIMWRATPGDTYPNGKAWVWDGGGWNLGTSGYGISDFTFSVTGLINRTVRRCGYKDNCALPFDNVWRSPALNGVYPTAPWKKFDDQTSDMWVGHTFRNLPSNIIRARLRFMAKPDALNGGAFNDAITVGLCNNPTMPTPPPYWMFSRRLEALPESGGAWTNNPKTVFTLDLHNLPDGGNIIGMMNSSGMLDMWVVDDTTVDWAVLEIWTCPPPFLPFGLETAPVGNALIGPWDPTERRYPIRNLGSSGEDGAQIQLQAASAAMITVDNPIGGFNQAGREFKMSMRGSTETNPDANLGSVSLRGHGSFFDIFPTISDWDQYRVTLMKPDGSVLTKQTIGPGSPPITIGGVEVGRSIGIYVYYKGVRIICISIEIPFSADLNGATYSNVGSIAMEPIGGSSATSISEMTCTGKHIPEVFLRKSRPAFFDVFADFTSQNLGQVGEVSDEGTQAGISNIGSSGQDGVQVDLGLTRARSAFFDVFVDADQDGDGVIDDGRGMQINAYGTFNGTQNHPLGMIRYRRGIGSFFDVFADFSDIGSGTKRIEVWNQGSLVTSIPGFTGNDIGQCSTFPFRFGKLGQFGTKCFAGEFDLGTVFQIGPVVAVGNELRVLADSAAGEVNDLSRMTVTGIGASEVLVWNASVTKAKKKVQGTVLLGNFGNNPDNVCIVVRPSGSLETIEEREVHPNSDGFYSFETDLEGSYDFALKPSHWLRQVKSATLSGETTVVNFALINGDCDDDNEITIVDFGIAAAAFGTAEGDPHWDPRADLDGDGEVTLIDVAIIGAHFGEAGDE